MAKFPKVEVVAHWAEEELHKGKPSRAKALALLSEAGEGPLASELREAVKKRGRQPFGAKHRWYEIGSANENMRNLGLSGDERYAELGLRFGLSDVSKLKTAIARYERAMVEMHAVDEENREP